MPRRPTLSPSKFATYLTCAVKYRWTYLDRRGRRYMRARAGFSFGSTMHRVLERFYDPSDQEVKTVETSLIALDRHWIDAGYASDEESDQARIRGEQLIRAHVEAALAAADTRQTVAVEKMLRCPMGRFDLIGRIDRIDEHADGTIEVVDYKSGRSSVRPEDVAASLAMGCYQILAAHHFPDRPVLATIVALRSGEQASAALAPEERSELARDLRVLGDEILDRDFAEIEPSWIAACSDCDFRPLCRLHPPFAEEERSRSAV
ncbi:MAG: PD-(D/E)XK nuclease family protein [Fimbriimonadaceae bacterium]